MARDLYSELERIEGRGRRIKRKQDDNIMPEGGSQKQVQPDPNNQGNNGGTLQERKSYQKDIYGELERIENRGKKKKRSLFSRS